MDKSSRSESFMKIIIRVLAGIWNLSLCRMKMRNLESSCADQKKKEF